MVPYFHLIQLHWVGCHPWSTMPTLEYDAPLVCVASPACGILKHMLTSFLIKLGSQIPFHIPRKHHTPSCTTSTATEDFHSLRRSKVSKFDGIRLYARLFKTLEKPRFPPYSIWSYSRGFYLRRREKKQKNLFSFIFSSNIVLCCMRSFFSYTIPLVEYDDLWVCVWSAMESSGVRWRPRARCHMSTRGRKSPERRIRGHNSPNSTERMLVVVIQQDFSPFNKQVKQYFETLSFFSLQNGKLTY